MGLSEGCADMQFFKFCGFLDITISIGSLSIVEFCSCQSDIIPAKAGCRAVSLNHSPAEVYSGFGSSAINMENGRIINPFLKPLVGLPVCALQAVFFICFAEVSTNHPEGSIVIMR